MGPQVSIELCSDLSITVDGRTCEHDLPGRQGRLAVAYLALERGRAVTREQLIGALWGEDSPARHGQALNVVLSKARRALGPGVIQKTAEGGVRLASQARVDLEGAQPALDAAFAACEAGDWDAAIAAADRVEALAGAGLLPGCEAPWLDDARRRLEELGLQARELRAEAGAALGGAGLASAERAAHELLALAPFRESGYLLLMRVREAQGNVAEALRVHERLRVLLRDELGVPPGPKVQAEFERLLRLDRTEPPPAARRDVERRPEAPAESPPRHFFATRRGAAFVGRRAELGRLAEYFRRAEGGERQLVLLEGEPGIGKTRLALQFMSACEAEGAAALYGRCDEQTVVPYQPFVEALRRHLGRMPPDRVRAWAEQHGAELGRVVPELDRARDARDAPRGMAEEAERYRLFDGFAQVFTDIARSQPLVLVLDDLHWADKPTLLMLRQMVRSADDAPLLIVAGYRDTERPPELAEILVDLRREQFFERIVLRGLDEPDAAALIRTYTHRLPERANRALWEETRGNPFFLEEMLRHLESRAGSGAEGRDELGHGLPEGIREVIGRRLAALSDRTGEALDAAAVIGREFTLELLQAATPLSEDQLDDVVEEAIEANVIVEVPGVYGRCSFTHSLVRQTLYEGLTATRRARLHLRVAEALRQQDGDDVDPPLAELAHHYSLAPPHRGAAEAVAYAEHAARRAAGVLAYEEAARLYAVALQALDAVRGPRDEERRCGLLLALGDTQTKSADASGARTTFRRAADAARSLGVPALLAQAALGYGTPGQMSGGVVDRDLVRLLEEALAALGEHAPALRARLLARLAMELSFSEQRERRAELSGEAVEISRRVDDTKALGFALVARHWSLWGPRNVDERQTTADDLLRLAERSGDVRLAMQGHRWRMMVLLELGEIDEVDLEIEAHRAVASRRRRLSDMVYVELYDAMRLLIAGAFDEAEAASRELRRLGERVQDSNAESAHLLQMLALRRERGGVEELEQMVRARAESVQTIPGWRCVLALLHAETGRHDEARRALEELSRAEFRVLPLDGIWLGAIAHLSEAAAAVGDGERAEVLYRLLQPYADRNIVIAWAAVCAGSASRHLGLLAAVLGRPAQAIAHFEDALAMNERMRARPLVARTQLELAQLLLSDGGDHERARDLLDSGLKEAEALGMPRLLEAGRQVRMEAMAGGARR